MKLPIQSSLDIISGVHIKIVEILKSVNDSDWERTLYHPEYERQYTLAEYAEVFASHGESHLNLVKKALGQG